nr:hypothetical protein [Paenibacillus harenae]
METTQLLGYPAYFLTLLGVAKIIGIIVLLVILSYYLLLKMERGMNESYDKGLVTTNTHRLV